MTNEEAAGRSGMRRGAALRAMGVSIAVNAVCPSILFTVLSSRHVPTIEALLLTAVFPVFGSAVTWLRTRRVDMLGLISLIVVVIGVLVSLASGEPRLYLVKDSVLTGCIGAVCLGSLLLPRPIVFVMWGHIVSAGDPEAQRRLDERWAEPRIRTTMRLMTLACGVAFGVDALFRLPLALYAPPSVVLLVNPIVTTCIVLGLGVWMVRRWRTLRESRVEEDRSECRVPRPRRSS